MDILDILKSLLSQGQGAQNTNSGMSKLLKMALPMLLLALFKNSQSKKKAESLSKALNDHETPSGLGNDVFKKIENADTEDGGKILGHIFGNDKSDLVEEIAKKAGVSTNEAEEAISKLTPVIMEILANKTAGNRSPEVIQDVVKEEIEKVGNEGSIINLPDIFKNATGGSKGGGIGDLLKNIFTGGNKEEEESTDGGGLLESFGGKDGIGDLLGKMLGQ